MTCAITFDRTSATLMSSVYCTGTSIEIFAEAFITLGVICTSARARANPYTVTSLISRILTLLIGNSILHGCLATPWGAAVRRASSRASRRSLCNPGMTAVGGGEA